MHLFKFIPYALSFALFQGSVWANPSQSEIVSIGCGTQFGQVSFQLSGPENGKNFALFLSGTPATSYFSEQVHDVMMKYLGFSLPHAIDPYRRIVRELGERGYRVLELKYHNQETHCGSAGVVEGLYAACCRQGLPAVEAHNQSLYDQATQALGYDPKNPDHRLVGLGLSLGAIQLQAMAFMSGRKFDRVGLAGVLLGNPEQGCSSGRTHADDGMSWRCFMNFADSLTKSTVGCTSFHPEDFEYGSEYRFENLPHAKEFELGLFEGEAWKPEMLTSPANFLGAPGNPQQVEYIVRARTGNLDLSGSTELQKVGQTTWKLYPGCGHEILYCSQGSAYKDILDFLSTPSE